MPLGWIDFSQTERSKVLSVLKLFEEQATLDELGIAPIRDGFADLFFPGTSTIQTRAKYFLIVPYVMRDLELEAEKKPKQLLRDLEKRERNCAQLLIDDDSEAQGIIGKRSLGQDKWVQRAPSDIYWAGLRKYGIFSGGTLSLSEYLYAMASLKEQKAAVSQWGKRKADDGEFESDDRDAGGTAAIRFWHIPTYHKRWQKQLSLHLTEAEGAFLRSQILHTCPDSLLAHILRERDRSFLAFSTFQDLQAALPGLPEQICQDYALAYDFSEMLYVIRTVYNLVVSGHRNERALREWERQRPALQSLAQVDLVAIFRRLKLARHVELRGFLDKVQSCMLCGDLEGMEQEICLREQNLKHKRAKTLHPGEQDPQVWYSGERLDYRFSTAKRLIRDILESEEHDAETQP